LTAALPIVRQGGTILLAAQCQEGLGSEEFTRLLLDTPSARAFVERLKDPEFFAIDQWQLQELCKVLQKVEVMMYSEGIAPQHSGGVLVEMVPSMEEGLRRALERHGPQARLAVVPKGPYVLTRLRGGG
jgi:nickel-dependent lactate racemase